MSDSILSSRIIGEMHWRLADIRTLLKCKTSLNKRQLPKKITPSSEKLPDSSVSSLLIISLCLVNAEISLLIKKKQKQFKATSKKLLC